MPYLIVSMEYYASGGGRAELRPCGAPEGTATWVSIDRLPDLAMTGDQVRFCVVTRRYLAM